MTSPYPLGRAALAVVASLTLASVASAQSTYLNTNATTTNPSSWGNWFDATNWAGGVPDAIDATAIFPTGTRTVSWTNDTATVGSVQATNSSGSVVLGTTSSTNDVLELATSTGKPQINVSSNSATIFMYANVEGTNGFTKTGGGNLSFRFNPDNMAYTGDILLNAGTLTVNQDGSLGNTNNKLLAGGNSTLVFSPGNNTNPVTLSAARALEVSNGVTLNIQTSAQAILGTINGNISGAGRLDFIGPASGTNDATSTKFNLNGTNSWTNQTTVQMGAKVTLGSGSSVSTNALSFSGGSGSWAGLDLGGNTQSVVSLETAASTATARVMVASNGTLNIRSGGSFTLNGTNGTLVNFSSLTAFAFDGAPGNRNFTVTPSTSAVANNTNEVRLAAVGTGSNNISANSITIGGGSGTSQGTNHQGRLILGKANVLSATSLNIGGFNGEGVVEFGAGITNGTTSLRGSNGVARMGNLTVGATSSGTRSGAGTLNISNGTIDGSISNTFVGTFGASSSGPATTSQITMGGGAFDTLNMLLSGITTQTNTLTNASATTTGTFQQNGGTVTVQILTLGDSQNTNNTNVPTFLANYNLSSSNAVLKAQTIKAGTTTTNYSTATRRKINFGAGLIETLDASTDLTISGFDTTSAGRIEIAVASNAQTKTFFADTNRKITLEQSAILTFDGGITKGGAGTLVLKGANVHNGNTTVAAGTLELQSTGSLRFQIGGSGTNNQLNGPGTASLNGQFVFNLASASTDTNSTWTIVSNSLTTTYGTNFLVTGFGTAGGGIWTNTTNGVNYVFAQSNGVLSVQATSGVTPYNAWVAYWQTNSAGFTNTAGTDNPDGDPFDNNEEFAFDGNPTIGTGALLTAVKVGTNAVFNYVALTNTNAVTYQVQITGNLTNGWTNASVTISNSLNQSNISQTNSYLRKEFTVPGTGNEFYRVQATIAP
jgi:fibronectin-binding autotransporter adhesin